MCMLLVRSSSLALPCANRTAIKQIITIKVIERNIQCSQRPLIIFCFCVCVSLDLFMMLKFYIIHHFFVFSIIMFPLIFFFYISDVLLFTCAEVDWMMMMMRWRKKTGTYQLAERFPHNLIPVVWVPCKNLNFEFHRHLLSRLYWKEKMDEICSELLVIWVSWKPTIFFKNGLK